ncbi:MAG: deoxyribose-phosphate aldolase [Lachnospiraceae bacterium]|nr:deoxyribose-phosphate aldolase [Lachnospiraceae bacterium]
MDTEKILGTCDHTLLKQEAGFEDIKKLIDEAVEYKTASVCIPPCFVKEASEYAQGRTKICTVIGFPNGYNTTEVKVFETSRAVDEGADEIDMVINIGMLKSGNDGYVLDEINRIKEACSGRILKVIVETCLLTEEEKIRICDIVNRSNADYIKTSTGFSTGGATFEDIELMAKHMDPGKGIKASGGISTLEDAQKFLDLGATRLGTSRIVKLVKG